MTFALFALIFCASFLPDRRLWGFNHLAYYSLPTRFFALAVIAVSFLPGFSRWAYHGFIRSAKIISEKSAHSRYIPLYILLLIFILFLVFQSSTLLLGDGRYLATNLRLATENDTLGPSTFFKSVTLNEHVYPGTLYLYFLAAAARKDVEDANPLTAIRVLVSMIGMLFILAFLHFWRRSRAPFDIQVVLFLLVLFSGGIALFFGYVETYAPAALAGTIYIFTAWRALDGKDPMWFPLLWLVVGCALHILCLLLVPSAVFLITCRRFNKCENRFFNRIPSIIIFTVIICTLIASRTQPLGRFFLPLSNTDSIYGIFSIAHLIDIINEIMLIFPAGLFVIFFAMKNRSRIADEKLGEVAFASLLLVPSMLFLFFFKPELGMARDWDLFSLTVFGFFPAAFVVLKRFYSKAETDGTFGVTILPVLMICAVLTIAWVGINASESKSVARFENILKYDQTNAGYAYENLALHFKDLNNLDKTIDSLEKAYTVSGNPRLISNLGQLYVQAGDTLKALETYRKSMQKYPEFELARANYIHLLGTTGQLDEIIEACRKGSELHPENPYYPFWMGQAYFVKGMTDEQLEAFRQCRRLNPPAELINEMNRLERASPNIRKQSEQK